MATAITGNTYPVRERLKALGGKWNADARAWMVPDSRADEARQIVAGAPAAQSRPKSRWNRGGSVREKYRRRYGWDGVENSPSYYSSGLYDEES